MQGISNVLDQTDYVLNLHLMSHGGSSDKTVAYLLGGNADGALVVSHHTGDCGLAELGSSMVVAASARSPGPTKCPPESTAWTAGVRR